ncbi:MAG TPA: hypothetical protein VK461_04820 [Acidimicrobiales bacterium]|nr:hypothetical protein [Acidimicrobiales bacterium]
MSEHERPITYVPDDEMQAGLARTRGYVIGLLYQGPAFDTEDARTIVWEHGRRNFGLRADGVLNVVCPVMDESELCGVCIYDATPEEVELLLRNDPGVRAGVFRYEVHPCRSFPGDALAG